MKSDNFNIEYKGRKANVTTRFDNEVEIFRLEWEDDGSLDFLYMGVKDTAATCESHTVLKPKDVAALGLLIENKTK